MEEMNPENDQDGENERDDEQPALDGLSFSEMA